MKPKILTVDIETMAAKVYAWKLYDETMGLNQMIAPPRMICWGAKFLGQKEMYGVDERMGRKHMLSELVKLVEQADAIVTYNGDKFDIRKINGELFAEDMAPLPPVTSIDLIKTARTLGLISNRLDFLATVAKIGRKIKNEGFPLWRACDEGDEAAWTRMVRYNLGDVRLTERAYKKLIPFIRNHPYLGDTVKRDGCPRCGHHKSQARGWRRTKAFLIQRLQCLGCGGWFDGSREKAT